MCAISMKEKSLRPECSTYSTVCGPKEMKSTTTKKQIHSSHRRKGRRIDSVHSAQFDMRVVLYHKTTSAVHNIDTVHLLLFVFSILVSHLLTVLRRMHEHEEGPAVMWKKISADNATKRKTNKQRKNSKPRAACIPIHSY